jgi:hypothetical protein
MASPQFRSTFVDGLLQQGEEKGLEKGREEGAVTSKIEDLIKVIQARGLELTKAQLELVTSCADLSQLATWFDQALDAKTSDEIVLAAVDDERGGAGHRVDHPGDARAHSPLGWAAAPAGGPVVRGASQAGENHWHGATPTRINTQIAYQESDDSGSHTTWGRHVTDEEYSG